MTELNDLRSRVEAAEERFGLIDEQQQHYSDRLIGLLETIEGQLTAARAEVETQIGENTRIAQENEELRSMLHSVLLSIEEKTFTQTLQTLETRVTAMVGETDAAEPSETPEEVVAEEVAVEAPAEEQPAADESEAEAAAETELEAPAEEEASVDEEAPFEEETPVEAIAEDETVDPEPVEETPAEEIAAAEEAVEDVAVEEVGAEATAEEAAEAVTMEAPVEAAAETAPEAVAEAEAADVEPETSEEVALAEEAPEDEADTGPEDPLAALLAEKPDPMAEGVEGAAEPMAGEADEPDAVATEAASDEDVDGEAMGPEATDPEATEAPAEAAAEPQEAPEAPETQEAEGTAEASAEAGPIIVEKTSSGAPTVKEIIRRVGDLARELERSEAQRKANQEKQAAPAESETASDPVAESAEDQPEDYAATA